MHRPLSRFALWMSCFFCFASACAATGGEAHWIGAWSASPDAAGPAVSDQTIRQVVRISAGGTAVRVRLSNLDGAAPLMLGPVRVASHTEGGAIAPGTDHAVSFNGKPTITLAKGEAAWSDAVEMTVRPLQELAVSLYVPANAGVASTLHSAAMATAYLTEQGDATTSVRFPGTETNGSRFFLTDVDVASVPEGATIVAFGDSITDGVGSNADAQQRWPDDLATRLQGDARFQAVGVANAGIGGNRILHDDYGPSALSRFDRDALDKANVRWIVLLEGINDIGNSGPQAKAEDRVTAEQVTGGMKTLIQRAHARGIRIVGATLTPFGGASWPYHSAANEAKRKAVNDWIRHGGAFDAVVDFDKAIRDPAHPDRMLPAYDSGDHLHPNGAGYKAMAASIDLGLFQAKH
ncbi:SGNH/GDSL hydrolase family protein [Dyella sp. EPa41]|uniref:SGNH/GDSL hydrolase family protein n=1 Tax=Dyella sp. EPa41 TaxID=1561194 RepID=UPI0019165C89|nr:SGNH/GDSL hydrolase family protein [Dyella sp. EPa41]